DEQLEQLVRTRAQQNLIVRLARHRYGSSDPQLEAAELITQAACEAYNVCRAAIWQLNGTRLEAIAAFRRDDDGYEYPPVIDLSPLPRYVGALRSGRTIDARDVLLGPRARELARGLLIPRGVRSVLNATIRVGGDMVGLLCLQH